MGILHTDQNTRLWDYISRLWMMCIDVSLPVTLELDEGCSMAYWVS